MARWAARYTSHDDRGSGSGFIAMLASIGRKVSTFNVAREIRTARSQIQPYGGITLTCCNFISSIKMKYG